MIKPPAYIPLDIVSRISVPYDWDDWDPYEVVGGVDERLVGRLENVSERASVTFAIGCAEWVVYRLFPAGSKAEPFRYIEACWAWNVSDDFEVPPELEDEDWKGPVRGAANMAMMAVLNAIYGVEDKDAASEGAYLDRIVQHVLPDLPAYEEWREVVLFRLEEFFPRNGNDPIGEKVPREVLDPNWGLIRSEFPLLVGQLLDEVDRDNPFLVRIDA